MENKIGNWLEVKKESIPHYFPKNNDILYQEEFVENHGCLCP